MADGTHKPIRDVKVGDRVLATDPDTGQSTARTVTALIVGHGTKDLVDITVDTPGPDATLTATAGHPFWDATDHTWVAAADLTTTDRLTTPDGTQLAITATHQHQQVQTVYNLTVDTIHTYYVIAGETPISRSASPGYGRAENGLGKPSVAVLVHNCGGATVNAVERVAPKPMKPTQAVERWDDFLGVGPHTNLHPRTGLPDADRLVSADGARSIRFGSHEMGSSPTKFHYHEETWSFDAATNAWNIDNVVVRVPFPKGSW